MVNDRASSQGRRALSVGAGSGAWGCGGFLSALVGVVFFSLFGLAGLCLAWLSTIKPLIEVGQARSWQAVPCTITASEVIGDETTSIRMEYDFRFAGKPYVGRRYSFFDFKTNGRSAKEKVVRQFPVGSQSICYVNPRHPDEAVINRNVTGSIWWGVMAIPFLAVGFSGLGYLASRIRRSHSVADEFTAMTGDAKTAAGTQQTLRPALVSNSDFDSEGLTEEPGPVTLKPASSPLTTFVVLLLIAGIWNTVVVVFGFSRWAAWQQGKWEWLPGIMLFVFGLVGILLIFGVIHALLGLFNPIPILTLSRRLIPLGGGARLSWQFSGSPRSIRRLRISLQGMEEARYTRGTNTYTDTEKFCDEILLETEDASLIERGEMELQIPSDSMHTFSAPHNKISWQIAFHGEIPRWPDVTCQFTVRVVPHE